MALALGKMIGRSFTAEVVAIDLFPLIWGQAMTSHRKDQTQTPNIKDKEESL